MAITLICRERYIGHNAFHLFYSMSSLGTNIHYISFVEYFTTECNLLSGKFVSCVLSVLVISFDLVFVQ